VTITRHSDPALFRARVEPLLAAREAENNLILGIVASLKPGTDALMLELDGVGAAVRTPPFNIVLSQAPLAHLDALVERLATDGETLPGVLGPNAPAAHVARTWAARHGLPLRLHHGMRIFECLNVTPPRPPADGGHMRRARPDEIDQVIAWTDAFNREANTTTPTPRSTLEDRLQSGAFVFWETDRVVAMAAAVGTTARGARIGFVYTPPALRGRGYASACTAALTRELLDEGRTCFLFTDLANPTSNKIYQAIGYRAVCDFEEWRFD
jgi:RimJ/RimL family protein N-acetyltransferase